MFKLKYIIIGIILVMVAYMLGLLPEAVNAIIDQLIILVGGLFNL